MSENDVRICPYCHHAQHDAGGECDAGITHEGEKAFHRCLCLARSGARDACPPRMTCQGGDLGYADLYYLQQGHSLVRGNRIITPDVLLSGKDDGERLVGYRARVADTLLRCLDHAPQAHLLASGEWWGVTADEVETSGLRRACSFRGCGVNVLAVKHPPATPCDEDLPCDADGSGEPCERHEREQTHAKGDHAFCEADTTCEVVYPSQMLRNTILYRAIPGSKGMLKELERRARAAGRAAVPECLPGAAGEE